MDGQGVQRLAAAQAHEGGPAAGHCELLVDDLEHGQRGPGGVRRGQRDPGRPDGAARARRAVTGGYLGLVRGLQEAVSRDAMSL